MGKVKLRNGKKRNKLDKRAGLSRLGVVSNLASEQLPPKLSGFVDWRTGGQTVGRVGHDAINPGLG
jgi:hypothetical protein